jgi:hypothetical protein
MTAVMSKTRSIMIVAIVALGRNLSRRLKTAGRTISPARPITKILPNPTDVAAKRFRRLTDAIGASNACHLKLRAKSVVFTSTAPKISGQILAPLRYTPTVCQSNRLMNQYANPSPIIRIKIDLNFLITNYLPYHNILYGNAKLQQIRRCRKNKRRITK